MTDGARSPYACLAMYPLADLRPAWEELWAGVHELAPWTPPTLSWPDDVHETWTDPRCVLTQACGWPVATRLRNQVAVVGAFELAIEGAEGHRYRTVLVAAHDAPASSFVERAVTVAVNGEDSLSGWISLLDATGTADRGWPGRLVTTGAHVESVRALRDGTAELASVDALTWAYLQRFRPELVDGLHVVGHGPLVPSLPIVTPVTTPAERVDDLRRAFSIAVRDVASTSHELLLSGFASLDIGDYLSLPEQIPVR